MSPTALPTKEDFLAFEEVRCGGEWNMYEPAALEASGLDKITYTRVMKNYEALGKKYPDIRDLGWPNG